MIGLMSAASALAIALRHLVFGVLIALMLVKPALSFATEIGELAPAAASALAHGQAGQDAPGTQAPVPHDEDGCGDSRWHLAHCCALQAALLPRVELGLAPLPAPMPPSRAAVAFVPTPTAVPFRPPIA